MAEFGVFSSVHLLKKSERRLEVWALASGNTPCLPKKLRPLSSILSGARFSSLSFVIPLVSAA